MKTCALAQILPLLCLCCKVNSFIFGVVPRNNAISALKGLPEKVEVCGFKDCRRAGGGARLEKLVTTVLEENNLLDTVKVEGCDCQGECGYGPNLLLDGKIVNSVKDRDAVVKALGIEVESS